MAEKGDFDVEQFRLPHESSTEWRLKREFLLAHHDKLQRPRLLCLASCFLNVECYGCTYPKPVMQQLKELTENLSGVVEHRKYVQEKNTVKFVKATEETPSKNQKQVESFTGTGPKKLMKFVKAADSYESTDVNKDKHYQSNYKAGSSSDTDNVPVTGKTFKVRLNEFNAAMNDKKYAEQEEKFYILSRQVLDICNKRKNAVEIFHMSADKAKMTPVCDIKANDSGKGFIAELLTDFVTVACGEGTSKKLAKVDAYEKALDILRKPYLRVKEEHGKPQLQSSIQPFEDGSAPLSPNKRFLDTGFTKLGQATKSNINTLGRAQKRRNQNPLGPQGPEEFIIYQDSATQVGANATSIMRRSADFNKVPISYEFQEVSGQGTRCQILLNNKVIADVVCPGRAVAKLQASERALSQFRKTNWTIMIKQAADTSEDGMSRDELFGELQKQKEKISDSNIGSKLLKKMGWSGAGGIGKEGREGISEPILVNSVINREGLGAMAEKNIAQDFGSRIRSVVQNYVKSNREDDLTFSHDFTKEERAVIHKECQKLGLKTHSHGSGDDRYLIASRKRSAGQLLSHVMESGGETSKYVLIPPGASLEQHN